ncbi:MAG: DUF1684 domain-containing protein [Bacteroidia bacterium]
MKQIIPFFFLLTAVAFAQNDSSYTSHRAEIEAWQAQLNAEYADSAHSPLKEADRLEFESLDFFPIDSVYRVVAQFKRAKKARPFEMKTTTDRRPIYEPFGTATFELHGEKVVLHIYQSHKLRAIPMYKDHLFLPFTDLTNGGESYGGGRFLDLHIPEGDSIVIDFNKAYNPYCLYNDKYSCPVPPSENHVDLEVKAGVKTWAKH